VSPHQAEQPFDSIESAQGFMIVLANAILDAMKDLRCEQERAVSDGDERREQAIGLAVYKLKTLNCHVHKGRRDLNDIRTLRRLILNERRG
jgi:hypothetical protein